MTIKDWLDSIKASFLGAGITIATLMALPFVMLILTALYFYDHIFGKE